MRLSLSVLPVSVWSCVYRLRRVPARLAHRRCFLRVALPVLLLVGGTGAARGGDAPSDLVGTQGESGVSLTWSAPTTNVSKVTGYQVLRRTSRDAGGAFSEIATTVASETSYLDGGIEGGETYIYRVKARRGDKLSASSNLARVAVPALPSAPADLRGVPRDGSVGVSWTATKDATITGYEFRFAEGGEMNPPDWTEVGWNEIRDSDASTTGFTVGGLTNGTAYTIGGARAERDGGGRDGQREGHADPAAVGTVEPARVGGTPERDVDVG